MGNVPAKFSHRDIRANLYLLDPEDALNDEANRYIERALSLAEKTLRKYENLLLMLADRLSDDSKLEKDAILQIFLKHAPDIQESSYITDGDNLYYRYRLKSKIQALSNRSNEKKQTESLIFSLNKNKTD